jgi:hypothetical protein
VQFYRSLFSSSVDLRVKATVRTVVCVTWGQDV